MCDVRWTERRDQPRQRGNGLPSLTWTLLGARIRAAAIGAATHTLADQSGAGLAPVDVAALARQIAGRAS